jgi:hypothetical protein
MKPNIPLLCIIFAVFSLGLLPNAQAVSPTPDGGYPGGNTAEGGTGALFSLTTGSNNTALGSQALYSLTTGVQNTAVGAQALKNNTANRNTAIGFQTLLNNTGGNNNTATGFKALFSNTSGIANTADGFQALYRNTTGNGNTATGYSALYSNTTGSENLAYGEAALASNINGIQNTAIGNQALSSNGVGDNNTAVGWGALGSSSGHDNIALGFGAGVLLAAGDNNIDIGNQGTSADTNTIRIGTQNTQLGTFIAGISGTAVTGATVVVNGNGQLGVAPSSARFKDDIKPMDKASDAILRLKPVIFRYKTEIDRDKTAQFGLVAEEVERVDPALITRDRDGKPFSVRYDAVNAMLLNEFIKEHQKVEELQAAVVQLTARLNEQDSKIDKINNKRTTDRVGTGRSRPGGPAQVAANR